jgi:hypothetical protein
VSEVISSPEGKEESKEAVDRVSVEADMEWSFMWIVDRGLATEEESRIGEKSLNSYMLLRVEGGGAHPLNTGF